MTRQDVLTLAGELGYPVVKLPDGRKLLGRLRWQQAVREEAPHVVNRLLHALRQLLAQPGHATRAQRDTLAVSNACEVVPVSETPLTREALLQRRQELMRACEQLRPFRCDRDRFAFDRHIFEVDVIDRQLAQLSAPPRRREPSAEHWRAYRRALEKHLRLGPYQLIGGASTFPAFRFEWDRPEIFARDRWDETCNGLVIFGDEHGDIVLSLRSDRHPDYVEETATHELQHLADWQLVAARAPRELLERRATDTARMMRSW
jgi:hypothetical protein